MCATFARAVLTKYDSALDAECGCRLTNVVCHTQCPPTPSQRPHYEPGLASDYASKFKGGLVPLHKIPKPEYVHASKPFDGTTNYKVRAVARRHGRGRERELGAGAGVGAGLTRGMYVCVGVGVGVWVGGCGSGQFRSDGEREAFKNHAQRYRRETARRR